LRSKKAGGGRPTASPASCQRSIDQKCWSSPAHPDGACAAIFGVKRGFSNPCARGPASTTQSASLIISTRLSSTFPMRTRVGKPLAQRKGPGESFLARSKQCFWSRGLRTFGRLQGSIHVFVSSGRSSVGTISIKIEGIPTLGEMSSGSERPCCPRPMTAGFCEL